MIYRYKFIIIVNMNIYEIFHLIIDELYNREKKMNQNSIFRNYYY